MPGDLEPSPGPRWLSVSHPPLPFPSPNLQDFLVKGHLLGFLLMG